jgi:haloalkane dehalogenase
MNTKAPHWLNIKEYPFKSNYWTINDLQQHYINEGTGDSILFVHGTPSWSFDYRHLIKHFRASYSCVALDHIGFGLSDKPEVYNYSPQHHGLTLERFIEQFQLKNITLVLHDFGGPIGMHYATKYPKNIKSIILLNTWFWDCGDDESYKRLKPVLKSPLLPFLYKYLNFSARYLLPRSTYKHQLPKYIKEQYIRPFGKASERNGTLAFARSLLYDQQWFEELWLKAERLKDIPKLFIWGGDDDFIKQSYLEKLIQRFPDSASHIIQHCGHFPQEEAPEEVIGYIEAFLNGTK